MLKVEKPQELYINPKSLKPFLNNTKKSWKKKFAP